MSRDSDLVQYVPARGAIEPAMADGGGEEPQPENPLKKVHSLLRGRYWLAILLAVVGAGAGAAAGYKAQPPLYTSTGLIRVQPYLPHILYQTEQNGVMPMFDAYIGSQVELLQGQRVTDLAMQNPEWVEVGRGLDPEAVVKFRESLSVARPKGSELILVRFEDADREAARIAVKSIISAYEELYGEKNDEGVTERITFLERRNESLSNELKAINERIFGIANELGSGAVESMYTFKLGELNKLESELRRAELSVAIAKGAEDATRQAEEEGEVQQPDALTAEAVAAQVPQMRSLLDTRKGIERQLKLKANQLGEQHREVRELQDQLAVYQEEIDELLEMYAARLEEAGGASDEFADAGLGTSLLDQVKAEERNVRALYDQAKEETQELGRKALQIESLRTEATDVRQKLDESKNRLESLMVERNIGGRVTIESEGDRPLSPSKDKRTQFAAAGAMGLGGLGVGVVMLLGLSDRRIRDLHDVSEGQNRRSRILGVLPHLPNDLTDPEQALLTAHSVHQIRMSLHGRNAGSGGSVFTVTSPSPNSGKTSLSIALGLSFASSRSRTLLIDCDIVGGGLTSKMKNVTRRRIGHILRRAGVITSAQLVEAVKLRLRSSEPLGEILVRLGYATREEIETAMATQRDSRVGLRESLNGEPVQECMAETGIPGLFLLPLGSAQRQHAAELSYSSLSQIIEQVRQWFDVIIIDTGPMLGSLEASVASMVADEVVMTVTRGENRANLQRSIEQITGTGTELAGIVLNRAGRPDIMASTLSSSLSRHSTGSSTYVLPERLPVIDHKNLRLGPIGTAVAAIAQLPCVEEASAGNWDPGRQ